MAHSHSFSCLEEVAGRLVCKEQKRPAKTSKAYVPPGHDLLFPWATRFEQLFETWGPTRDPSWSTKIGWISTPGMHPAMKRESMTITPFVSVREKGGGYRSFYAKPRAEVVTKLQRSMVISNYDQIGFQIVVRDARQALVSAQHSQIIGSRWLAFIDPKSIPQIGG